MRLRNVKGAREDLSNHHKVLDYPVNYKGIWKQEIFKNQNPIHIEIGMGKGGFLSNLANDNPNINYIGFEKYSSVLVKALDKLNKNKNNNLYVVRMDVENICDLFAKAEISKIYLNFSDPWPKDRHIKRRLTSENFLNQYSYILKKNSSLEFKTDNKSLFDFSMQQFINNNWELKKISYNLHSSTDKRIYMTEYEKKFVSMEKEICYLEAINNIKTTVLIK